METAIKNYEQATTDFRRVWESERKTLSQEFRDLEEYRARLELEAAEGRRALESEAAEGRRALESERRALESEAAKGKEDRLALESTLKEDRRVLESTQWSLKEERRILKEERAYFAAEIAVRTADRVLLDVGGKHFSTTRRTLKAALTAAPDSLLGAMFSGTKEERLLPDGKGRVFIDRNGAMFEYILDFLRGFSMGDENAAFAIHALPKTQMMTMEKELNYYGLQSAVFPQVPFSINLAKFSPGPEMLSKRMGFGAVVLPKKRGVLVVGGFSEGERLSSTELLDLKTGTFSLHPSMGSKRWYCGTAVLESGQVVVVGGSDVSINNESAGLSTTEIFSTSNIWSSGPNLATGRCRCAALPLSKHRVLVIGGSSNFNAESSLSTTEIIDFSSGTSTPGPEMSCPRSFCSAVMLHDGRVLVIGGRNGTTKNLSTVEILDLTSGISSPGPKMDMARCGTSAVLLPEGGGVLVIGGQGDDKTDLFSTEVLDLAGNATSPGPELIIPRCHCSATILPGDRILVVGGFSDGTARSNSEILGMPTEGRHQ